MAKDNHLDKRGKSFCILPWIHMATYTDGKALLCCVAQPPQNDTRINLNEATLDAVWNSYHWKQTRKAMIDGKPVAACKHCTQEERAGIRSHRINENILWTKKLGEDYVDELIESTQADGSLEADVITLDLRLGNTCNVQCVMCRPVDSSKWVKDAAIIAKDSTGEVKNDWDWKIQDHKKGKFDWAQDDEFWEEEIVPLLPNMRHFIFAGGEPLYLKNHKRFLKMCVASGHAGNIELRYHTNGTIMPDDILELWSHFKAVEVMLSIDAPGGKNHWLRYPTDWDTVKNTLDKIDKAPDNIKPKILCTVSALNIFYLPEFGEWLLEQNYKKIGMADHGGLFHPGILHYPQYMCAKVLPQHAKEIITLKLRRFIDRNVNNDHVKSLESLITFMNSEDWSDKNESLRGYIKSLDKMRGTDFDTEFKEFCEIWK